MTLNPRRTGLAAAAVSALALPLMVALAPATVAETAPTPVAPGTSADFKRHDVDTDVTGAAFTSVGELFPGEKNIVTTGYGALDQAVPAGGGTLQVYRPGDDLGDWDRVEVFGAGEEIIFPNRPTIVDVDGDGLNDIMLPSGYFFDTNPNKFGGRQERSAITWWKNLGLNSDGSARGFERNDVITGVGASYHGVELVDLDGDGIRDIVTTAEAAVVADNQYDDEVTLQYLRGIDATTFAPPVTLAEGLGGSHPHVTDIDGDGDLDIVSSQYFNLNYTDGERAAFLWFERTGDATNGVTAKNFTPRTIATVAEAGFGFQIQAVPDFREKGKVSWIGTNHQGRCFVNRFLHMVIPGAINVPEMVMEFVPGDDVTKPWKVVELSRPAAPVPNPQACDADAGSENIFNLGNTPVKVYPTDQITARSNAGQAGPGVFGYGDLDGDGDVDLAVSGDGDRRLFWVEQRPAIASNTVLRVLSEPEEYFGQSGGAIVEDLDGDGRPEMIFSSFDENTVAVWTFNGFKAAKDPLPPAKEPETPAPTVRTVATTLQVTAPAARPRLGKTATWKVRLNATKGGQARRVKVTYTPRATGKARNVTTLRLTPSQGKAHNGRLRFTPHRAGTLTFTYAPAKVSATVREKGSVRRAVVRPRR